MPRHNMIDGVQVPFTTEEETARDAEEATWAAGANDRAFAALRKERDTLLHDTDWWASSDLSIAEDQTTYRQELRDLPANTDNPNNPTWPTPPE
jgi:hypothetical protein